MVDQTKAIFVSLREKIYAALEADVVNTLSREQLTEQLSEAIDVLIDREQHSVATVVRREYVKSLVDEIVGLGPLQPLMDDESISDIMINGHDNVFIERNGW
ncbi:type II/IV secretion system ATP hydrolase TadA/VirB11/CpaF TadA subfamily [Vibrio astriarenae]|nr:type II/IV secretion system ATP hydrolase TadA/VirB11/CpaF TadA subfamily [Vibrio sp. C7]